MSVFRADSRLIGHQPYGSKVLESARGLTETSYKENCPGTTGFGQMQAWNVVSAPPGTLARLLSSPMHHASVVSMHPLQAKHPASVDLERTRVWGVHGRTSPCAFRQRVLQ
jgi:hypothetical protein